MTSRDRPQECFVYITPSGETEFVTAGRFQRTTDRHGVATGRFVYGRSYLERDNAVPIDPIELKLSTKTYETRLLNGIFGALRDASPDHSPARRTCSPNPPASSLGRTRRPQ